MHEESSPSDESQINRRSALALIVAGAGTVAMATLGLVAGFVSNAFGRSRARPWIRVGAAEDLDSKTFTKHVLSVEKVHAWVRTRVPVVVYVKDNYSDETPDAMPTAFHSRCSHLGCSVAWKAEDREFHCPCHGAVYDQKGRIVSGPQPRPLTRLDVKIEDEACFVRFPEQPRA